MSGNTVSKPFVVCSKCKSDEVVNIDRDKRTIKCLACGHKGESETIWYLKRKTNRGTIVKKFVSEASKHYLHGKNAETMVKAEGIK